MKEYTITKTLFKMKKKHILPSESREGKNYMKESLGQFFLWGRICEMDLMTFASDGNFAVLSPVV